MKQKKIPYRMCVITREKYPKDELIRIVRTPDNTVELDLTGKLNGKGAYLKKDVDVFKKAQKNKVLNKILETEVDSSVFEKLNKLI